MTLSPMQQVITPDGSTPSGADLLQSVTDSLYNVPDSLAAAVGGVRDTITAPPLPGGVATLVRWIFGVPQTIQIGGAIVGALVAAWCCRWLWLNRTPIWEWLSTRSTGIQVSLAGLVLLVMVASAFAGAKSWNYMQHDNGFCAGCHVMSEPFQAFASGAGKHDSLQCHDCHQQSIFASTRQLVLWVANRPVTIDDHAPVPDTRCESCHSVENDQEPWEHVEQLAGHRVHFESDSVALDSLMCVTCHGAEVHAFIPSGSACSGSGCHEQQGVALGGMAELEEISCVTCHRFTQELVPFVTRDSAVQSLMPHRNQCFSCHEMTEKLPNFVAETDPHDGNCGTCHDVHVDSIPADAIPRCATCHDDLATSAFHDGVNHREVRQECLTCHDPHAASVDASNCAGCHTDIGSQGKFTPPLPFDTSQVLRNRVSAVHDPPGSLPQGKGDVRIEDLIVPSRSNRGVGVVRIDSFPHERHDELACLTCHVVDSPARSLTFDSPRGCELCHHQELLAGRVVESECAACHTENKFTVPTAAQLFVQTEGHAQVGRGVTFWHEEHVDAACSDCHVPPESAPADSVMTCSGCHESHHEANRDCSACHGEATSGTAATEAHDRDAHMRCDACHEPAIVERLVPDRAFCVTCHLPERDHLPEKECTVCHFLQEPSAFRGHLTGGAAPR